MAGDEQPWSKVEAELISLPPLAQVNATMRSGSFLTLPAPGSRLQTDIGGGKTAVVAESLAWFPPGFRSRIGSAHQEPAAAWRLRIRSGAWAPEIAADNDALRLIQLIELWIQQHGPVLAVDTSTMDRLRDIAAAMTELSRQPTAVDHRFGLKGLALQLFSTFARDRKWSQIIAENHQSASFVHARDRIQPALNRLANTGSLCEDDCSVIALAEGCGLRPSRFHQLFKIATGLTPQVYLVRLRISRSCDLLLGSDLPIQDIAQRCGFSGTSRYNESFKKIMGRTPREFRMGGAGVESNGVH